MIDETDRRVSCAALEIFLATVKQEGLSSEAFLEGMPFDEAYTRRKHNRISWADYCTLVDRLTVIVGGPEGLRAVGKSVTKTSHFRAIERILGLLTGPRQMYVVLATWVQPMMWPMCSSTVTFTGPETLRIDSVLPEGYRPSQGFFEISAGGMALVPTSLNLPMATVRLETDGRTATFFVKHPASMTIWMRLRRMLMIPWRASALLAAQRSQIAEMNERLTELDVVRQRAAAAEAVRDELMVNISHELRTPMLAILDAGETLSAAAMPPAQREAVQTIRTQTAALLCLIEDTLNLSRTIAGRLDLNVAPTDVRALLDASFKQAIAAVGSQQLSLRVAPGVPELVHLDGARFSQVLRHLLDNAIKFAPGGQISLDCDGEWVENRYTLQVTVSDTGEGISPDWLRQIFEPFTQQDGSLTRRAQGAGLGLAVARGIIEMMGGTLLVTSTPGVGSHFQIALVVAAPTAMGLHTPIHRQHVTLSQDSAPPDTASGSGVRVLLVEDNAINRLTLSRQLQALGYQVDTADDGVHGVERFSSHRYDLVLMDIQMPRLDGFAATAQIRRLPGGEDVPVLAVTANAHPGYAAVCLSRGLDGFLAKPVPLEALAEAVALRLAPAQHGAQS